MLERLAITDFAVARSVVVVPGPGLNVFTGETGAGKSLIVDALAFVFGARRGREVIATGAERATVVAAIGTAEGLLTVERTITASGRSSARVNGEPAGLEVLQALAAQMVEIHGQSDQLAILRPAVQLAALDGFAGAHDVRSRVAANVRALRDVRRQLEVLSTGVRERERLLDQLRFEADEIATAAPRPGEDVELRATLGRLSNAGRLAEDAAAALDALEAPAVGEVVSAASDIAAHDPSAQDVADPAALFEAAAADLARALRRYRDGIEEDPERLAATQDRLDLLARLRRKYGDSLEEVIAYGNEAEARLAALSGTAMTAEELRAREGDLLATLAVGASELSWLRRDAASGLIEALSAELGRLGMGGAGLALGFACDDDPAGPPVATPDYELVAHGMSPQPAAEPVARAFNESGVDRVEFLVSFNPGESARPLASVASGGETSRFLLALTTALGAAASPRTVVLDEVDEGVGGRAGALVGEALARLATAHQVLCVTHLPQVAAYARQHFVVGKQSERGRTWSDVSEVTGDVRVEELAAMLGGVTEATRATARELLEGASPVWSAEAARPG